MTHDAIIALANEAAQAAMDVADDVLMPSARDAYDFIRDQVFNNDALTEEQADAAYDGLSLTTAEYPVYFAAFNAAQEKAITKWNERVWSSPEMTHAQMSVADALEDLKTGKGWGLQVLGTAKDKLRAAIIAIKTMESWPVNIEVSE